MKGGFFIRESKTPGLVKFTNDPSTDTDTDFKGISVNLSLQKIKQMIRMLGAKPPAGMKKFELQKYLIDLSTGQREIAPEVANLTVAQIKDELRKLGRPIPKMKKAELLEYLNKNRFVSLDPSVVPSGEVVDKKIKIRKPPVPLDPSVFPTGEVVEKQVTIKRPNKKATALAKTKDRRKALSKSLTDEELEFQHIVDNWSDGIPIYIYKSKFFKKLYDNIVKRKGKMVIAGNLFDTKLLERLLDALYERYGIETIDDVVADMVEQLDGKMKKGVYIRYVPKLNEANGRDLFEKIA